MIVRVGVTALCMCISMFIAPLSVSDLVPGEGKTLNRTHILFKWDPITGAVRYHLQVAPDGPDPFAGSMIVDTVVTTPWHIVNQGLEWAHSYAWRVWGDAPGDDVHRFSIMAIPSDMPQVIVEADDPGRFQPGVTMGNIIDICKTWAVDESGKWVWIGVWPGWVHDVRLLPNGNIFCINKFRATEATLDINILWQSPSQYMCHHEAFPMYNGNVIAVARDIRPMLYNGNQWDWKGDQLVEFDRDHNLVWNWSAFDHISMDNYDQRTYNIYDPASGDPFDWTHTNSVVHDPRDDSVYISVRNLSRIMKIDHKTGDIIWTMGFPMQVGDSDFGDDLFSFQHAPQLLPNGNMLLFDNGSRRGHSYGIPPNAKSKAIELAFDWNNPEPASIVWEYTLPGFCSAWGDADRLPNGNTLVAAGKINRVIEVDANSDVVWQIYTPGLSSYRSERVPSLYIDQYWDKYEIVTAPNGRFLPGWVWFSIPLVPRWTGDASQVLGFDCRNRLFAWDETAKNLQLYPDDFTELTVGRCYAARLGMGERYVPAYEGAPTASPFERSLPAAGWSWVGVPSKQDIWGLDIQVARGGETRTPAQDESAPQPWINWNWVFWDSALQTACIMNPFGGGDDECVRSWSGYLVWAYTEGVTIIFPPPE
jgi:hypothetical protein